ncbi:MAG: DUF2953 domain-containing protein, partial [Caloramator sp.]|nr:DUF2953 domain-containing protein [Caloramator sp.]
MGIIVLAVIIVLIFFFLMSNIVFSLYIGRDKKIIANIVIFKVIKINIYDKNKRRKKNKTSKSNIPPKIISELLKESLPSLKYFIEKSSIYIRLDMVFGLSSPDKTAITYGLINSFLYTLDCFLINTSKKVNSSYNITPDLKDKRFELCLDFNLYIRLFRVIIFILKLLKALIRYKSYFRSKGGVVY